MERRFLECIADFGCGFDICKLRKNGKNTLDFYITTRLGELFGGGYEGIAVIVGNDTGFQAVREEWGTETVSPEACTEKNTIF